MQTRYNKINEEFELIATDEEIKEAIKQELYLMGEIVDEVVIEAVNFDYEFKVSDYLAVSELNKIETEILMEAGLIEAETREVEQIREVA